MAGIGGVQDLTPMGKPGQEAGAQTPLRETASKIGSIVARLFRGTAPASPKIHSPEHPFSAPSDSSPEMAVSQKQKTQWIDGVTVEGLEAKAAQLDDLVAQLEHGALKRTDSGRIDVVPQDTKISRENKTSTATELLHKAAFLVKKTSLHRPELYKTLRESIGTLLTDYSEKTMPGLGKSAFTALDSLAAEFCEAEHRLSQAENNPSIHVNFINEIAKHLSKKSPVKAALGKAVQENPNYEGILSERKTSEDLHHRLTTLSVRMAALGREKGAGLGKLTGRWNISIGSHRTKLFRAMRAREQLVEINRLASDIKSAEQQKNRREGSSKETLKEATRNLLRSKEFQRTLEECREEARWDQESPFLEISPEEKTLHTLALVLGNVFDSTELAMFRSEIDDAGGPDLPSDEEIQEALELEKKETPQEERHEEQVITPEVPTEPQQSSWLSQSLPPPPPPPTEAPLPPLPPEASQDLSPTQTEKRAAPPPLPERTEADMEENRRIAEENARKDNAMQTPPQPPRSEAKAPPPPPPLDAPGGPEYRPPPPPPRSEAKAPPPPPPPPMPGKIETPTPQEAPPPPPGLEQATDLLAQIRQGKQLRKTGESTFVSTPRNDLGGQSLATIVTELTSGELLVESEDLTIWGEKPENTREEMLVFLAQEPKQPETQAQGKEEQLKEALGGALAQRRKGIEKRDISQNLADYAATITTEEQANTLVAFLKENFEKEVETVKEQLQHREKAQNKESPTEATLSAEQSPETPQATIPERKGQEDLLSQIRKGTDLRHVEDADESATPQSSAKATEDKLLEEMRRKGLIPPDDVDTPTT